MAITTLTNGILQRRLQIANCCAAHKGYDLMQKQKKGHKCEKEMEDIQFIVDSVDSLTDYISYIDGEYQTIQQNVNPYGLEWTPTGGGSGSIAIMDNETNLVIGIADWDTDLETTVGLLLDSMNRHVENGTVFTNPWGSNTNGYTGTYEDGVFTVSAPANVGATYNGNEVFFAYQGGVWGGIGTGQEFANGIDSNMNTEFDDTETYLKTNEIITILEKLSLMCEKPCTEYVNFS